MPTLHLIAKARHAGKRLDIFIIESPLAHQTIPTRSTVTQAIERGSILVNQSPSKSSYRLKAGDIVTGELPEATHDVLTPDPTITLPLIFENEYFLVIDKPAGIQVHPSATEKIHTVANWLIDKFPDIAAVGEDPLRPGIVHRLDKNTSGLMVIAKTQEAFAELKRLFAERKVSKTYIALVHGHIRPSTGAINTPIARSKTLAKQSVATPATQTRGMIRSALTEYQMLESYSEYDLIETKPKTGRTHQIRVHLASIGHPVVGDRLYGNKITRAKDQALSRHFLHAHKLSFIFLGNTYNFSSPLSDDFQKIVQIQ